MEDRKVNEWRLDLDTYYDTRGNPTVVPRSVIVHSPCYDNPNSKSRIKGLLTLGQYCFTCRTHIPPERRERLIKLKGIMN